MRFLTLFEFAAMLIRGLLSNFLYMYVLLSLPFNALPVFYLTKTEFRRAKNYSNYGRNFTLLSMYLIVFNRSSLYG